MAADPVVIGIDLGSADSYVAYVSGGHVDLVQNEVSQRAIPSLVSFTDRERLVGEPAAAHIRSNAANTCRNFKHLLGRKLEAADLEQERFWSTSPLCVCPDGSAGFEVCYKGEERQFSAVEITAMYLAKLKETAEKWCEGSVTHAVIGVPSYFSDVQRRAVLDAAEIANLKVLRLMNEHAATALAYGQNHAGELNEERPRTVVFCSMGHSIFNVAIVQFSQGELRVLGERSGKVGARVMEKCLLKECASQFKRKTGLDPLSNKKAALKLEDAVAKAKKVLSANTDATISVECLMEDEDFSMAVTRADVERMCEAARRKTKTVIDLALSAVGLPLDAIDAVEMAGGGSRVPWVKRLCSEAFGGKPVSTTVNQEESVARGCALQAAALSPFHEVKPFEVTDVSPYAVQVGWLSEAVADDEEDTDVEMTDAEPDEELKTAVIFPEGSRLGTVKTLTFFRRGPFHFLAEVANPEALLPLTPKELGIWRVELPPQDEPRLVKVRLRLGAGGIFEVDGATVEEEPRGMSGHRFSARRPRAVELKITASGRPGLGQKMLRWMGEAEAAMQADMREVVETNELKNDLEASVLALRDKCVATGVYGEQLPHDLREAVLAELAKTEEWLYDSRDGSKALYAEKLAQVKAIDDAVAHRATDERARAAARRADLMQVDMDNAKARQYLHGGMPFGSMPFGGLPFEPFGRVPVQEARRLGTRRARRAPVAMSF